jgi:hypothetical protein
MKFSISIVLLLSLVFTNMSCQKKLQQITVQYTQPYCGGARPTPEILADAEKVKPYAGKMLIIVSDKGKTDSAKTDVKGIAKLKLTPGTYKVYEAWRFYKSNPSGEEMSLYDKPCLEEEWKKHAIELTITKSKTIQKSDGPIALPCYGREYCRLEKLLPH